MALIQCPECGHSVSDRAVKCPKCGYPIVTENTSETEPFQVENSVDIKKNENSNNAIKSKKLIITLGAFVVFLIIISLSFFDKKTIVENIEVNNWKLVRQDYSDRYEGTVNSDHTKPFIAVIGYSRNSKRFIKMVYMEDGNGIIETEESNSDDPSVKYAPIGYFGGEVVNDSDIDKINYKDFNYNDWAYDTSTSCRINIDIKLKNKNTGLLFLEFTNSFTDKRVYNCAAVIVNGEGNYSYYLSDLPFKSRGVKLSITPKYFCVAKSLDKNDYTVKQQFSLERFNGEAFTSFTGTKELKFDGFNNDGIIIYKQSLTNGNTNSVFTYSTLDDQNCVITTYDSYDSGSKIIKPKYEFEMIGYIPWLDL